MNRTRLLRLLFLLTSILLLSCEKEKIDSGGAAFGKLEIIDGNNQSGHFGEILADIITIKASSNNLHRKYLIKYELVKGNGIVRRNDFSYGGEFSVDSTGILELEWRLGCDYATQQIKIILYVDSARNDFGYTHYYSEPSDAVIVTANGTRPQGWGRSCGCEHFDVYSSEIISYDDKTLYLINRGLYSSTDGGMNWYKVDGVPNWNNIVDAQFNSYGWLYVLTKDYGICYSKDLQTWQYINNGILDHRDPTAFMVEDSALFVSFYFDGPYKTINNGQFWRKLLVGGQGEDRYYEISRHPNGDLYLFDKWSVIWISKDYGKSWAQVQMEYKYRYSPVYDLEIDKDGQIYIGANDATISKISPLTYTGETHRYYEMNHYSQNVEDIKIINNTAYFTVIGSPSPGVYSSQNWSRLNLNFNKRVNNYYLRPDGTFLLISDDGLYYYNE